MIILRGRYQLTQLYIRVAFSLPAQAPVFLICAGDSAGASYCLRVMPRPAIDSTKNFMEKIKQETVPNRYKMVSFDVKSLFTSVFLEKTINSNSERIYDCKEINAQITYSEIKDLLTLYAEDVHFIINNQIYLNWIFLYITWKCRALRTLIKRVYLICSSRKHLVDELNSWNMFLRSITIFPNGFWTNRYVKFNWKFTGRAKIIIKQQIYSFYLQLVQKMKN